METDTAPMTTNEQHLINGRDVPEIRTTVDSISGVFVCCTRCHYQQRKTCLALCANGEQWIMTACERLIQRAPGNVFKVTLTAATAGSPNTSEVVM